jgi:hypothetical protein
MIRSMLAPGLVLLLAGTAIAQPKNAQKAAEKKAKELTIKEFEEQKFMLREQEKMLVRNLEVRFDFIINNLDPKEIHKQLEEGAKIVRHVREVIGIGEFDYGGNRQAAEKSLEAAESHIKSLIEKGDNLEQRKKAAVSLLESHSHVKKALTYSIKKYGLSVENEIKQGDEPESRATANRHLAESLPKIELTYHLLSAVNHEIKDYQQERNELSKKRDDAINHVRVQISAKIKQIDVQIKALKK